MGNKQVSSGVNSSEKFAFVVGLISLLIGLMFLLLGEPINNLLKEYALPLVMENAENSNDVVWVEPTITTFPRQENFATPLPDLVDSIQTPTGVPIFSKAGDDKQNTIMLVLGDRDPIPYVHLDEVGKVYTTEGIFSAEDGSVSVWLKFLSDHPRRDHSIFHTDDSRYVLYVDTYTSSEEIVRIVARAGGNGRAVDSSYVGGNFPEASIIIDNNGSLKNYGSNVSWYASAPYPEDEWHHVVMTWDGYPFGEVRIYLDGVLIGEKPYDPRYDDGRPLPSSLAIGFRDSSWRGEIVESQDGEIYEHVQRTNMVLSEGGLEILDLRLYKVALDTELIRQLTMEGVKQNP